ncbi:HIT family hydrolase [Ornatilinea apprima]|uniref:HIT family hydrolase n=1 Tax=Ornatilinea apprima TaxID=1134406 RepID=A0A0P6Y4K0_9CHLR|nr:HIT domain-containing protein [Ornatilinea apprima]KPL76528.1 HIT family hydrolase [Ornatilinea apprima]
MDYLWSPWRMDYIKSDKTPHQCVFCEALKQNNDEEMLILTRAEHSFIILNRYPYNNGHLMVVPYAHKATLNELDAETRAEMMELLSKVESMLKMEYRPEGINMGVNIGAAAGAGVADHIHFHVVPRWNGDVNFMGAVALTRVLPEDLWQTYQRMKKAWEVIEAGGH